jgi:hypothetical protein
VVARTVRQAARELEVYGGWLEVQNSGLVIHGPTLPSPRAQPANDAREVAELLAAAKDAIVAAAGKSGRVDPAKLPDQPVGAAGGLL